MEWSQQYEDPQTVEGGSITFDADGPARYASVMVSNDGIGTTFTGGLDTAFEVPIEEVPTTVMVTPPHSPTSWQGNRHMLPPLDEEFAKEVRSVSCTPQRITRLRGVLDEPPSDFLQSILFRGSNGVARWVTLRDEKKYAEDDDDHQASAEHLWRGLGFRFGEQSMPDRPPTHPTPPPVSAAHLPRQKQPLESALWVVKYTPKHFVELLSDESANLVFLRWMKSWDSYVFPKDPGAHRGTGLRGAAASSSARPQRPDERVALLVGPPGVGKTTLAHVVARHCGYMPVEVNASVDRTVKSLEHIMEAAVANASAPSGAVAKMAAGSSGRSNNSNALMHAKCLIIDEIDGIAANVIPAILERVRSHATHRPIICLANNLYSPSLRPMRNSDFVIVQQLPPITVSRMLPRLEEILRKEKQHSLDKGLLADVAHSANGDVRASLNTLQLLCCPVASGRVGATSIKQLEFVRIKEAVLTPWSAWREIFLRRERPAYVRLLQNEFGVSAEELEPRRILAPCSRRMDVGYIYISRLLCDNYDFSGTGDVLTEGLFEQYLQQPYADYSFTKSNECADAFSFHDIMSSLQFQHGLSSGGFGFVIAGLTVSTAAQCHLHCSTSFRADERKSQGYPRMAYASAQAESAAHDVAQRFIESVARGVPGEDLFIGRCLSAFFNVANVAQDLSPFITRLLELTSTAGNKFIGHIGHRDRMALLFLAARHATYGLTYTRKKKQSAENEEGRIDADSTTQWTLEPDLGSLAKFHSYRKRPRVLREDICSVLVGEIEQHKIKCRANAFLAQQPEVVATAPSSKEAAKRPSLIAQPKAVVQPPPPRRDFFGRILSESANLRKRNRCDEADPPENAKRIRYHHHEGSTNAVRRNATISDFL